MSCEICGREIKYYGHLLGGLRCPNFHSGTITIDDIERSQINGTRQTLKVNEPEEINKKENICYV